MIGREAAAMLFSSDRPPLLTNFTWDPCQAPRLQSEVHVCQPKDRLSSGGLLGAGNQNLLMASAETTIFRPQTEVPLPL